MKTDTISKVCTQIDMRYRYTFYPLFAGETGLIEIEVETKNLFGNYKWKRIYMGHLEVITTAIDFYNYNTNNQP